jgi:hypothetical protein
MKGTDDDRMVDYKDSELEIIAQFEQFNPRDGRTTKYEEFLASIPQEKRRYKCMNCYKILNFSDLVDGKCPECNDDKALTQMCALDHNHCPHGVMETLAYCPVCGQPICPECGDHNVLQQSRITGYIQDVSGFNAAKQQELRDRTRYVLGSNSQMVQVNNDL